MSGKTYKIIFDDSFESLSTKWSIDDIFFIFQFVGDHTAGLTSYKPTHYLLDYGDEINNISVNSGPIGVASRKSSLTTVSGAILNSNVDVTQPSLTFSVLRSSCYAIKKSKMNTKYLRNNYAELYEILLDRPINFLFRITIMKICKWLCVKTK